MTAEILSFPAAAAQVMRKPPQEVLTRRWADQRLPLIDAALDLLQADDVEFERRCRTIAETEGPTVLAQLVTQLYRLGAHVVSALAMTAMRIRTTMATGGAGA